MPPKFQDLSDQSYYRHLHIPEALGHWGRHYKKYFEWFLL